MDVIILHGACGNPTENWFNWLRVELEQKGYNVAVPQFPTPQGQNLENWLQVISTFNITQETVLIGHSIACAFMLSLLEKYKTKAAFFVAPWVGNLGNEKFDTINASFMKEFDYEKIKANCSNMVCFGSDNDPYVSLELEKKFAANVGVELNVIEEAGHFNEAAGYTEFKELLRKVIEIK